MSQSLGARQVLVPEHCHRRLGRAPAELCHRSVQLKESGDDGKIECQSKR